MMRDLFIQLLNEQPRQNGNTSFTKVNIHIALFGEISRYCINLNKDIQKITKSLIDFRPASVQIPHLTIEMAYVKTEDSFKNLMKDLYDFATDLSPFEVQAQRPYFPRPQKDYLFVSTNRDELIIEIKRKAKRKFKDWVEPLGWDVSKEAPHITVGYITDKQKEVEHLIEQYPIGPRWVADTLEISYVGVKGSCLGTIRSFAFGSKSD